MQGALMRSQTPKEISVRFKKNLIPEHLLSSFLALGKKTFFSPYVDYSQEDFPEELIPLVKKSPHSLLKHIEQNRDRLSKINKKVLFLIVFTYPNLEFNLFNRINELLDLSDKIFLQICITLGNNKLVQSIMESHSNPEWVHDILKEKDYQLFRSAVLSGSLCTLETLAKQMPSKLSEMIEARQFEAFTLAAQKGHFSTILYLSKQIQSTNTQPKEILTSKIQEMIAANNYAAFRKAFIAGHLSVINYLVKQAPDKILEMIKANNYHAFRLAAENNQLSSLHYLIKLAQSKSQVQGDKEVRAMVTADNYYAFRKAACHGNLSVLKFLVELTPDQLLDMIAADNYGAFRQAAENGHLDVLKYLSEKAPDKFQKMIEACNYESLRLAASGGHLSTLEYLVKQSKHSLEEMISASNYYALRTAAINGHLNTVKYLIKLPFDHLNNHFKEQVKLSFAYAAGEGNLSVLKYLFRQFPEQFDGAICELAFRIGASKRLSILKFLARIMPKELHPMMVAKDYSPFCVAAYYGNVPVLKYLVKHSPDTVSEMLQAKDYSAFRSAIYNEHLAVLQYFSEIAPEMMPFLIESNEFEAFRQAAMNGSLPIMKFLIQQLPPLEVERMMTMFTFAPFRLACSSKFDEIVNFLLNYSNVFAYAESYRDSAAENYVKKFIDSELESLRKSKGVIPASPITQEKAKHLFYMARALISRSAPLENLLLILEIPEVRELAHQEVTPGQPNELLRVAQRSNNLEAFEYLLSIPAVREEAEANDFYQNEIENGVNLRVIAQNKESSLRTLNDNEEKCLEDLKKHYLGENSLDSDKVIEELRNFLINRYEQYPASITIIHDNGTNEKLFLPHDWKKFQSLNLSKEKRKEALEAYYSNKNHTAWRYLSKPNFWINPQAIYIKENEVGKWSYFEPYKELISILFLAAKDENIEGIDGYDIESRINQFIDELCHIGRAHNWDESRSILNKSGKTIVEEFDDKKGDNPSCFSGTKSRLFQSLQGHYLLKKLTLNVIKEELREFVWNHFQNVISDENKENLASIWKKVLEANLLSKKEENILKCLNISKSQQDTWFERLKNKYGEQASCYRIYLHQQFNLNNEESHFIHFSYLGLDRLLENQVIPVSSSKNFSHITFFDYEVRTKKEEVKTLPHCKSL